MRGAQVCAAFPQDRLDLQCAAGVRTRQQIGRDPLDVVDFARTDFMRRLRLEEVVGSRTPAALIAVGNLQQLELRNRSQQFPGLGTDALRVREVACVVVGDPQGDRPARRPRFQRGQVFVDVPHLGGERARPFAPLRFAG